MIIKAIERDPYGPNSTKHCYINTDFIKKAYPGYGINSDQYKVYLNDDNDEVYIVQKEDLKDAILRKWVDE